MKDQYFGDARDYFKYHLLEDLMATVQRLERLVCLWMLTPPDSTGEGNVPFVESSELPELTAFLRHHRDAEDRRVSHLREYFRGRGIEYVPWGDERPYFSRERRRAYFESVPDEQLQRAIVFFDPDIGLTTGVPTPKHLAFDELIGIHERMADDSLAVVFQYRHRKPDFWEAMASEIRRRLRGHVGYVADGAVAFFVISKDPRHTGAIDECLQRVARAGTPRKVGPVRGELE